MIKKSRFHGVVRGKTIELADDPGLADGFEVEVVLLPTIPTQPWGEGLRRWAGALADTWTAADDDILDQLQRDRQASSGRELPQ